MAREPEPKSPGGNQDSVGNLSDYVSGRLNDISRQKSETESQVMEAFIQRTALLRAYLLELARPMDELLAKFKARELLEEVKTKFWRTAAVEPIEPDIYRDIVTHPNPSAKFFYLRRLRTKTGWTSESGEFLDSLLNPGDFRKHIPSLIESKLEPRLVTPGYATPWYTDSTLGKYGIALKGTVTRMSEQMGEYYMGGGYRWYPGGGGGEVIPSSKAFRPTGRFISVSVQDTILVEVVHSQDTDKSYDLLFKYKWDDPVRISTDDFPDSLRQMFGDRIVKELAH